MKHDPTDHSSAHIMLGQPIRFTVEQENELAHRLTVAHRALVCQSAGYRSIVVQQLTAMSRIVAKQLGVAQRDSQDPAQLEAFDPNRKGLEI